MRSSGTTGAPGPPGHAVKVPALSWTRTHPRRPVRWRLGAVGACSPRCPLGAGVSSG